VNADDGTDGIDVEAKRHLRHIVVTPTARLPLIFPIVSVFSAHFMLRDWSFSPTGYACSFQRTLEPARDRRVELNS
jgi:hypothetical protein